MLAWHLPADPRQSAGAVMVLYKRLTALCDKEIGVAERGDNILIVRKASIVETAQTDAGGAHG